MKCSAEPASYGLTTSLLLSDKVGLAQSGMGRLLGIDYTGVSVARNRLVRLFEKDKKLKEIMKWITNELSEERKFDP